MLRTSPTNLNTVIESQVEHKQTNNRIPSRTYTALQERFCPSTINRLCILPLKEDFASLDNIFIAYRLHNNARLTGFTITIYYS